jgi:hypothetical protein
MLLRIVIDLTQPKSEFSKFVLKIEAPEKKAQPGSSTVKVGVVRFVLNQASVREVAFRKTWI